MARALLAAAIVIAHAVIPGWAAQQQAVRLTVSIVMADATGTATPVPRHALLVSDVPPSAAPQRILTSLDGIGGLNLRPGRYIVESEQAVAILGQAYRWVQTVEVVAGREARLELNAGNAIVEPLSAGTAAGTGAEGDVPADADPSTLLRRWQDSVVALWTPTAHASGFVIDARGIIATSQRAIGAATAVEVQLTPDTKVAGLVLGADPARDVALVRIDAAMLASGSPMPLDCSRPMQPLVDEQDVLAIGASLRGARDIAFGMVRRVSSRLVVADFALRGLSPGGPVFADDGRLVGVTSVPDADVELLRGEVPIVSTDHACAAARSIEDTMRDTAPPAGTLLPVEPDTVVPMGVLENAAAERADNLSPYVMSSSDFDIAFLTPVLVYAGLHRADPPSMDFSNWSDYVRSVPPVLLVRVTPKQSESFWMKLLRGAALTQGAPLPPITHFEAGFARLRAFCGDVEVTPLHPFRLELRISETEAVHEGLVAFAPDALGPHCGTARLMLYSEKDPDEADTREIDPGVLQQIWQDLAPYRAPTQRRGRGEL